MENSGYAKSPSQYSIDNNTKAALYFAYIDKKADRIPIIRSITNAVVLFQKILILPVIYVTSPKTLKENHYFSHINNKEFSKCFILSLPLVGDLLYQEVDFAAALMAGVKDKDSALFAIKHLPPEKLPDFLKTLDKKIKYDPDVISAIISETIMIENRGTRGVIIIPLATILSTEDDDFIQELIKNQQHRISFTLFTEIKNEEIALTLLENLPKENLVDFTQKLSPDLKKSEKIALKIVNDVRRGELRKCLEKLGGIQHESVALAALEKVHPDQLENLIKYLPDQFQNSDKVKEKIQKLRSQRKPAPQRPPSAASQKMPWICPEALKAKEGEELSDKQKLAVKILQEVHNCPFPLSEANQATPRQKHAILQMLRRILNKPDASSEQLQQDVKKTLLLQLHPDKNQDISENLKDVYSEAYTSLLNMRGKLP